MALYVHIPFCVRKCHYCDFAAGPAPEDIRAQYVEALAGEIRACPQRGARARTLFFGGGTPSELDTAQLGRIVEALHQTFEFSTPGLEATIECNPGTVDESSLAAIRGLGFNRISLGVQSFHDHHLKALGRIHDAAEARAAVRWSRGAGFERLSLDLIFCLPGQTLAEWQKDVEDALALAPEHLSLYNLTIEDQTEFGRRHRLGLLTLPDEDLSADMYEWSMDRLASDGWVQYEVSNFARSPDHQSRHNRKYWDHTPYLGLGPSAHSLADADASSARRFWNERGTPRWERRLAAGERPIEGQELLGPKELAAEALLLGLRTVAGIDLDGFRARYGIDLLAANDGLVARLVDEGRVVMNDEREGARRLVPTLSGLAVADGLAAAFDLSLTN